MTTSKPQHITASGHVRLTITGTGIRNANATAFTLERRHDLNTENWYPAAGFRIEDLDSLDQIVQAAKQHLRNPEASRTTSASSAAPAQAPDSAQVEEPPFDPDPPVPPPLEPNTAATPRVKDKARPTRKASDRTTRVKPKPTRKPSAPAKVKSRTR